MKKDDLNIQVRLKGHSITELSLCLQEKEKSQGIVRKEIGVK